MIRYKLIGVFIIFLSFWGCTTSPEYPTLIASDSLRGSICSNNPSLSLPESGFHPFIGVSYNDKQDLGNKETNERTRFGSLHLGLTHQPSLNEGDTYGLFYQVSLSGSYINYNLELTTDQIESLKERNVLIDKNMSDYEVEGITKIGLLSKSDERMLMFFLLGTLRYEDGEFSNLRKKLDGIDNIYNIADNNVTYGFGVGLDLQAGSVGKWDAGMLLESQYLFNKTQSISYASSDEPIDKTIIKDNGDSYRSYLLRFEPYFDYKHTRISIATSSAAKFSFMVTYRF